GGEATFSSSSISNLRSSFFCARFSGPARSQVPGPRLSYSRYMKTFTAFVVAALVSIAVRTASQYPVAVKVADKVAPKAVPFPLESVRLLDGPFRDAMIRDQEYLLSLDQDRLLHNFRV